MNRKSKIFRTALIGSIVAASYFGYSAYFQPKRDFWEMPPSYSDYFSGKSKPIAGPHFVEGDPKDLKFQRIDLGIAQFLMMSEQGDVLYKWYGDKPNEIKETDIDGFVRTRYRLPIPIYRLRRVDGSIRDLPPTSSVFEGQPDQKAIKLTRGGHLLEVEANQEKLNSFFTVVYDGKPLTEPTEKSSSGEHIFPYWDWGTNFTDDGVFPNGSSKTTYLFGKDSKLVPIDLGNSPYVYYQTGSSELGTIGFSYEEGFLSKLVGRKHKLSILKDGKVKVIDLPNGYERPIISPTKNSIFIHGDTFSSLQPYEFKAGKFSVVPTPLGCVSISGISANSHDEMIFEGSFKDSSTPSNQDRPFIHRSYYIANGKCYRLDKLYKHLDFPETFSSNFLSNSTQEGIDEQGNFLAYGHKNDYNHLYILKRIR